MLILMLGLLGAPGWVFLNYEEQFFLGSNTRAGTWQTDYVYARRGQELLVSQQRERWYLGESKQEYRLVQLTPRTPLFRWVTVVEPAAPGDAPLQPGGSLPPAYAQWTPVQKPAAEFSLDDDEQQQLNELKAAERRCQAKWARFNDRLQRGQAHLLLPPASRRGANTIGCRFNGEVWRDFLPVFEGGRCQQRGAAGVLDWEWNPATRRRFLTLQVAANMRVGNQLRSLHLILPGVRGPGVYVLGPDTAGPHANNGPMLKLGGYQPAADNEDRNEYTSYVSAERPRTRVTITRFDTVARVISGTFEGYLRNPADTARGPLPLREGRFDVRYLLGPGLERR
ncbi:hypothetical protein LJ737_16630 [Hymenobacter sp. 15J16-1T3B]|uniref:hypothetical protein n=1 Tax=Hymenobacter sp. 15J16-1T3B TaxID=2886941 RepID=UPI001D124D16|nr:hypothetical protein [Hymenobacter sp. 15J16-1T3B]MCC3158871.1 hypothetical protein [Hymenobacter sp. 15J16-1T3B]